LLELTGVNARRSSKAMAVVLGERFNKAVTPVSSSPAGLSSGSVLSVIFSRRDQPCLRKIVAWMQLIRAVKEMYGLLPLTGEIQYKEFSIITFTQEPIQ